MVDESSTNIKQLYVFIEQLSISAWKKTNVYNYVSRHI